MTLRTVASHAKLRTNVGNMKYMSVSFTIRCSLLYRLFEHVLLYKPEQSLTTPAEQIIYKETIKGLYELMKEGIVFSILGQPIIRLQYFSATKLESLLCTYPARILQYRKHTACALMRSINYQVK